jgi:hypothetical protein
MSPLGPPRPPEFNREKFKALVHYVCAEAPNPKQLGATKLNKIAFYSDMESYLLRGRPITGEVYVKLQHGPVSQHIRDVLEELKRDQAIAISEATGYSVYNGEPYRHRLFFSLRPPDLSVLNGEELKIIDEMLRMICQRHTARSISEHSHNVIWESAEMGEEIPYFTVYAHFLRKPSEAARVWAEEMIGGGQAQA